MSVTLYQPRLALIYLRGARFCEQRAGRLLGVIQRDRDHG